MSRTRPEAVKLAPVVEAFRKTNDFRCTVVATGQHKEMFQQVADTLGLAVDANLDAMRPNQTLAGLTARLMDGIDGWLGSAKPDMALVQGDTTTVLVAASKMDWAAKIRMLVTIHRCATMAICSTSTSAAIRVTILSPNC